MTPTPSIHASAAPPVDPSIGDAAIRARAHAVLTEKGLTVDDLRGRMPLDNDIWHRKIVAALTGDGPFTSLTLALFAEAVGIEVSFLISGERRPKISVHVCRVDDTGDYESDKSDSVAPQHVSAVPR